MMVAKNKLNLDTPVLNLLTLNLEQLLYLAIFVIAVVTHFYDLGARAMSHDESLHTLYSWKLYAGQGYVHDPMMHGPFLFHLTALFYFLFGDDDFTARIGPALFGITLVMFPYLFRPWLGRVGALAASLMILISPGLLYYTRYIRHDPFIVVWTPLMILAFFQYMRTRGDRWLFVGAAAVSLMLTTMEVAYIHGYIGFTFIVLAYMWENLSPPNRRLLTVALLLTILSLAGGAFYLFSLDEAATQESSFSSYGQLMLLLTGLLSGAILIQFGVDRANRPVTAVLAALHLADLGKVALYGGLLFLLMGGGLAGLIFFVTGILRATGMEVAILFLQWLFEALALTDPGQQTTLLMAGGVFGMVLSGGLLYAFGTNWLRRLGPSWEVPVVRTFYSAVLLAVILFVLLFTTFFSNIGGLYSGLFGALEYWLRQQEVQRGGQPWYYYMIMTPLYEFLPVFVGVIGGIIYLLRGMPGHDPHPPTPLSQGEKGEENPPSPKGRGAGGEGYPSDGGTFAMFVIYWAFLAGIIYSWAGEKMPWLTVHITLPLVFLSAHLLQTALGNFDWAGVWRRGGAIFGVALLLLIPALVTLNSSQPFQSQSLQSIRETLQFMMAAVVLVILAVVLWRYGRRLGGGVAARLALLSVLLMLSLLTIRFSWMLSFINYDYASEFLVYAHGGPDVKPALVQIDDISRRTVGDKMIKVAYDSGSTWPLEWYMREYPNRAFYGENPTRDALDAPVVIVDASNENKVKPYLGDKYTRFRYRLIWWPPEDYKNQSLTKIWENYVWPPAADDPALNTPEGEAARWELARRNREKLWRVFFYREHEYQLNEWPYVHRFYMYVRNDVLNEVWDYQGGPVQLTQSPAVDPYANKRFEANALNVWGSNGSDDGRFVTPRSLAVGPDGLVYVLDTGNNRVQVFDRDGKFLLKWGSQGFGDGQFNEPWGIAVGPEGAVYVADTWNHRLQAFSPNGQFLWKLGSEANVRDNYEAEPGKFWGPRGIAVDPQGNLYVTDTGNKRVQKFSPDGQFIQLWGGGGIVPGFFEEPVGIDVDSAGNIYVADTWNYRIQKFDPNFAPVAQWPVAGGWQGESVVNKPFLAVDAQGRVFITDPEGYRIIAYSNTGELLGTWGQYGQDLASFTLPVGLDFDPAEGTLFVADADSNRVMAFKPPF